MTTPTDDFYCKEWHNVGYRCPEGQCDACKKDDNMNTTPTPEEMQKFKAWCATQPDPELLIYFTDDDWLEVYHTCEAYHQHRLNEVEPYNETPGNAELRRKVAALQGQLSEAMDAIKQLAKNYEQQAAYSKEAKETYLGLYRKEVNDLKQQLTEANAEIERLKGKLEPFINTQSMYDNKGRCKKCGGIYCNSDSHK
jgi:flagellar biosynthesis chaperone FliJ